jgi:hypothetical protein
MKRDCSLVGGTELFDTRITALNHCPSECTFGMQNNKNCYPFSANRVVFSTKLFASTSRWVIQSPSVVGFVLPTFFSASDSQIY